jgi:hypothetical protein
MAVFHTKIIMTVPATPVDENGFAVAANEFSCQKLVTPQRPLDSAGSLAERNIFRNGRTM